MLGQRLLLVIGVSLLGLAATELLVPFSAQTPSRFMQRIAELKLGRLPPASLVRALERRDNPEFARALCRHGLGSMAMACNESEKATVGWAICLVGGRAREECTMPKVPSLGFGFCMAAARDLADCYYVEDSSPGFGLCMAAKRSFNDCKAVTNPSLNYAYCMQGGASLSSCINRER